MTAYDMRISDWSSDVCTSDLAAEPAGAMASIVAPQLWDHTSADLLRASACHLMYFVASRASAEGWQAKHPAAVLLPLDDAFEFGRRSNAHRFGAELAQLGLKAAQRPGALISVACFRRASAVAEVSAQSRSEEHT